MFETGAGKKRKMSPFIGRVTKYLPPSTPPTTAPGTTPTPGTGTTASASVKKDDSLYHVVWDDGDECDYDVQEFGQAVKLYDEHVTQKISKK